MTTVEHNIQVDTDTQKPTVILAPIRVGSFGSQIINRGLAPDLQKVNLLGPKTYLEDTAIVPKCLVRNNILVMAKLLYWPISLSAIKVGKTKWKS